MSSHSPLRFLKFINQKLKYCNLKQAKQAENRQKSAKVACYKLQYFNYGLKNFQKLKSHSREDWSPFEAQFERTGTINNILFLIKMLSAFSSFEMGTTFSCCPYHILKRILLAFSYDEMQTILGCRYFQKVICINIWKINVVRIFFFWNEDNIFMLSVLIFEKKVVRIFFLWNVDNIFRLSVFSRSYPHRYLENKCCPHFLSMKCGQHFKLSACCPVIRSCPHFINTRFQKRFKDGATCQVK